MVLLTFNSIVSAVMTWVTALIAESTLTEKVVLRPLSQLLKVLVLTGLSTLTYGRLVVMLMSPAWVWLSVQP